MNIHEAYDLLSPRWRLETGVGLGPFDLQVRDGHLVYAPTGDRVPYPDDWKSDGCYVAILDLARKVGPQ